ncbi:MAG TPA: hypothetical protein VNR90_03055 [Vicinamibacterales bacterium]|nr:hypothetical protein [Vicinamibacterales bacterium]
MTIAGPAAQAPAPVTAADAAPYLGEWTLALQGERGPATFNLSVKVENEKVVADVSSDVQAAQKISTISKTPKSLVLSYFFPYEAQQIDAVISLTPGAEGKVAAQIDFAGGAYTMTGTATKKEKAK